MTFWKWLLHNHRNVLLYLSERELWLVTVTPENLLFVVFVMVDSLFLLVYLKIIQLELFKYTKCTYE